MPHSPIDVLNGTCGVLYRKYYCETCGGNCGQCSSSDWYCVLPKGHAGPHSRWRPKPRVDPATGEPLENP